MAYNEKLADRIRELISASQKDVEEKKMFGGLCFMVNGKMCVGVEQGRLMVRLDPERYEEAMEKGILVDDRIAQCLLFVPWYQIQIFY